MSQNEVTEERSSRKHFSDLSNADDVREPFPADPKSYPGNMKMVLDRVSSWTSKVAFSVGSIFRIDAGKKQKHIGPQNTNAEYTDKSESELAMIREYASSLGAPSPYIKLLLFGTSGVGKTCIRTRILDNIFTEIQGPNNYGSPGQDDRWTSAGGRKVRYRIDDALLEHDFSKSSTSSENSKTLLHQYTSMIRCYDALLLVYTGSQRSSFDQIVDFFRTWQASLPKHEQSLWSIFIVASKADRERYWEVPLSEAQQFSDMIGATMLKISAKNGTGTTYDDLSDIISTIFLKAARRRDDPAG